MLKRTRHWYVDGFAFSHGLWEDASAIVKTCFCVGVFGGGTVHLFRVLSEVLYCSVFSNPRIGNSFRYWWKHVTLSHRKPLIIILSWFPCVIRCSVRSSGCLLIAHAIVSLVPLLNFHSTWIYSCVSWRRSSLHGLLIELQVEGVSRGLHNSSLHGDGLRPVTICPTSRPNVFLIPTWSQSLKKGATQSKRFTRAKQRHNILISK